MLAIIVEGEKADNYAAGCSISVFSLHLSALLSADEQQQVFVIRRTAAGELRKNSDSWTNTQPSAIS